MFVEKKIILIDLHVQSIKRKKAFESQLKILKMFISSLILQRACLILK